MNILIIERAVSSCPIAYETGTVPGDDPDAEGYERTFRGHIDYDNPDDCATLDQLRETADAIYEVDNLVAHTKPHRIK